MVSSAVQCGGRCKLGNTKFSAPVKPAVWGAPFNSKRKQRWQTHQDRKARASVDLDPLDVPQSPILALDRFDLIDRRSSFAFPTPARRPAICVLTCCRKGPVLPQRITSPLQASPRVIFLVCAATALLGGAVLFFVLHFLELPCPRSAAG